MPIPNDEQALRRQTLRELLSRSPANTQQALVDALNAQGFVATQSSVSRDLREIGAIKTAQGYELPVPDPAASAELAGVSQFMREILPAGPNLLVIKTAIGAAQRVALALDRSHLPGMIGNIGGDDTVFVATASAASQKILIRRIQR
jgi:transcriptional regulator of arginine metabolism